MANGRSAAIAQDFLEPNLSFRLLETELGVKVLRVYFELELRPGWAESETVPGEDLFVSIPLADVDLRQAVEDLRRDMTKSPQRAVR